MPERRKYDPEFRDGAVRIVRETGEPIVEVARDLGTHPGTLGNWLKKDRLARGEEVDPTSVDPSYVRRLER
jgi:transposase